MQHNETVEDKETEEGGGHEKRAGEAMSDDALISEQRELFPYTTKVFLLVSSPCTETPGL
eukprot:m.10701 g.10701  ORF g.10701 m.10701 type:complete len:60 (+) comp6189_c0_seq1:110-289(+)